MAASFFLWVGKVTVEKLRAAKRGGPGGFHPPKSAISIKASSGWVFSFLILSGVVGGLGLIISESYYILFLLFMLRCDCPGVDRKRACLSRAIARPLVLSDCFLVLLYSPLIIVFVFPCRFRLVDFGKKRTTPYRPRLPGVKVQKVLLVNNWSNFRWSSVFDFMFKFVKS